MVSQTEDIAKGDIISDETDNDACAFYIRVPSNNFYGNVAAGGQQNGFDFYSDGIQKDFPLGAFIGNVAHSNKNHGMKYDYYENYADEADRYIIDTFRSFKNLNACYKAYK